MPPASLSTFAVMNPGPTTAKKSRIRIFQRLKKFMCTFRRHKDETQTRGLKQRPIFALMRERAGTQSRTRINAPHNSEQTKSAKKSKWKAKVESGSAYPTGSRKRQPDTVPRASLAAC